MDKKRMRKKKEKKKDFILRIVEAVIHEVERTKWLFLSQELQKKRKCIAGDGISNSRDLVNTC